MDVIKKFMQHSLTVLLALVTAITASLIVPTSVRGEVFYAIGFDGSGLYSIDTVAGGPATLVAPVAASGARYTLATRPSDGMLFYFDSNGTNPNLWRWDPANPTAPSVFVGTPGATTTNLVRLGFDSAGNLWAMDPTSYLWKLNPNTGAIISTTPISGPAPSIGGDLCLHPTTGVLYMFANNQLFTVTTSGVVSLLGTISGVTAGTSTGCAFDRNGRLVISTTGAYLMSVNIGTMTATNLPNPHGVGGDLGDLATAPSRSADLRLSKIASNATPGNAVSFTVTVTNDGPDRATDVRVLDALPAGLTFASASPSQGVYSATAVTGPPAYPAGTWRVGTLNNGATATLSINANVTGTTPITNTAQVSYSDQYDPDSTPNNSVAAEDDQASVTVTPSPDLRAVKTATSSFAVGANATYSITVNNTLGALSTGANAYTVVDNMPTGLTLVSASGTGWNCSASTSAQMSCTSSTAIAAGGSNANAITLTVLPGAAASPSVTNTATVSGGGEPTSNSGNNSSTITTSVCSAGGCPDLVVNKTSAASFTVGTAASYTLSVSNIGGLSTGANTYTISDTLPTGITLTTAAGSAGWTLNGWTCTGTAGGSVVSCSRSTALTPGSTSNTVVFPITVSNAAAPSVTNTASVTGGGEAAAVTGNNSTSLITPVVDFDLTVSKVKTTAANFVLGVNTATYTLTVNNIGGRATTGTITVIDTLPAGLTLNTNSGGTGWTIGSGWTCTQNSPSAGDNAAGGSRVVCTRTTAIAANSSAPTIVFPVAVGAAAAPSVTNTVTVSGPSESTNLTGNNSASLTTAVDAPDLVVTKTHTGNFIVGQNGSYTITVVNQGEQATSTATLTVTDTLPAGLTFVSAAGTGWTCSNSSGTVTCTRTTPIAANTAAPPITLTVLATAAAASASPVTNNVSVSGGNEPAGNNGNNSDADITYVYYSPVISKSFSPASITAGSTSTLTLTISNPAGNTVSLAGLAVVDPFPAGMSVVATPAFSNSCGGTVSPGNAQGDNLLSLTGGSTGGAGSSCTIQVNVTSSTVGASTNTTGQVSSTNSGTGNTASATLTVTAAGSPILTKLSAPNPVGVNQPSTLTFTITNKASTTNDMGFTDTLPSGMVVASPATFGGTCTSTTGTALSRTATAGSNTITVAGVDLAANASCTVTINVRSATAGSYLNATANITGLQGGLTATTLSDTLVVQSTTLTKSFSPSTIVVNTTSTLTFTITNGAGAPSQNGLAFTETLPGGLVVAVAPNPTQCSGTVTATAGGNTITLANGALALGQTSCSITVSVTSSSAATYNNVPANISGLSSNIVNNATATLVVTSSSPSLVFMKTLATYSDPVNTTTNPYNIPGAEINYTLRVTNTGNGAVDSNTITIVDPIPANTELFTGNLSGGAPFIFTDSSSPSSGLACGFTALGNFADCVDFSTDGTTWNVLTPNGGYDPAVTHIRFKPTGAMAADAVAGSPSPYFDLTFRVRVK